MDKKKKINYFADYKLKFISQLFLSNRRMHCALLLYILCCNVITYRIWGIFYFSTGGPCTSICHLSILLWLCCGLWSHTQWPLPWSTVTYAATSFFFDIHVAFLGFRCLVWFGLGFLTMTDMDGVMWMPMYTELWSMLEGCILDWRSTTPKVCVHFWFGEVFINVLKKEE